MSRTTAILALVQALLVTLGFFALAIVLKASGYPDYIGVRWNPFAVFLRTHGFWLILLAPVWACAAIRVERRDAGILSYRIMWLAGVCVAASIIALFLYAAIFPYFQLMILKVR